MNLLWFYKMQIADDAELVSFSNSFVCVIQVRRSRLVVSCIHCPSRFDIYENYSFSGHMVNPEAMGSSESNLTPSSRGLTV
jgi:hypothetical protein